MIHFSRHFELGITSHSQIDFVDTLLDGDIPLYLDPDLIAADRSSVGVGATESIASFFSTLFDACRNEDFTSVQYLLSFGREPNETHLGMSRGLSRGRGSSTNQLYPVFARMIEDGYFQQGLIELPSDIPLWTPNFERDRMSDLLVNVVRQDLFLFTTQQYAHLGIPLPSARMTPYRGVYWDSRERRWTKADGWPALTAAGFPILLVPKAFVCQKPLSSVSKYVQRYVLAYRQERHLNSRSALCQIREDQNGNIVYLKPPKQLIREAEMGDSAAKDYARRQTLENPRMLEDFRRDNRHNATHGNYTLSDDELDYVVYVISRKAE